MANLLELKNISYRIKGKQILHDISFALPRNSFFTIAGNNGAGKSTLCKIIANALKPNSGEIIKAKKCKLSYIPQVHNYNILVPITTLSFLKLNNKKTFTSFENEIIQDLQITTLLSSQLKDLSGGEKQRVLLARALISKPDLLILDEPTAFIDFRSKSSIYNIINKVRQVNNFAVLLISHDMNLVFNKTDWVIYLEAGHICCEGKPHSISKVDLEKIFGNNWNVYHHGNHLTNNNTTS